MGEAIGKEVRPTGKIPEETTEKRSGESTSTTDSNTRRTRTRTSTATRGTDGRKTEEKTSQGLALVDENKKKQIEKIKAEKEKAGITQAPPISTVPKPEPAKPKRASRKRKKKTTVDSESVEKLLMTVTGVIATRPDCEQWAMQKKEAQAIAQPLVEILDKYDLAGGLAENSAEIALVVASVSFVAPRIMITANKKKEKKKDGMAGKSASGSTGRKLDETRKSKTPSDTSNRQVRDSHGSQGSTPEYGIFGSPL